MKNNIMTIEKFKKEVGVHITTNHNGKMTGMQSLSTSCAHNPFCQARSKDLNSICSKCYAQRQMKMYKNMDACFTKNSDVLCNEIIDKDLLPTLNCLWFRFESFGDLANETQLINYFNICNKNPNTRFALWTKNPQIIENVLSSGYKKPKNINLVLSSLYMNDIADFSKYKWVDRVFSVFDEEYIKENNVEINCGGRSCMSCLKCYKKSNKLLYINEKLK